jgi:hypothetical protein
MTPTKEAPMTTLTAEANQTVVLHTVEPPGSEANTLSAHVCHVQGAVHTLAVSDTGQLRRLDSQGLEMSWDSGADRMSVPVRLMTVDSHTNRVTVEISERRGHTRVDSSLLFRHRRLTAAEGVEMSTKLLMHAADYLEEESEVDLGGEDETWDRLEVVFSSFHRMLRDLTDRVDHLTAIQEGRSSTPPLDRTCRVINISGGGLAFEHTEPYAAGTPLRLSFDISRYPYRSILCLGEVVRTESRPCAGLTVPSHLVYVRFTQIREEDRDRIIHYVFRMQRRMLRSRREA